jgi:hypothetical protein
VSRSSGIYSTLARTFELNAIVAAALELVAPPVVELELGNMPFPAAGEK